MGSPLRAEAVEAPWMRAGSVVTVTPEDRGRLGAIVPDGGRANRLKALGGGARFQAVCKT